MMKDAEMQTAGVLGFMNECAPINMELSDYYEEMSDEFTCVVPKTHQRLQNLIQLYDKYAKEQSLVNTSGGDGYYMYVFGLKSGIQCEYCNIYMTSHYKIKIHINTFHQSYEHFKKWPYSNHKQDRCPMGCKFSTQKIDELKMHLVLYHSAEELKIWGYSRQYLK